MRQKFTREEHALFFNTLFMAVEDIFTLVTVPDTKLRMIKEEFFPKWLVEKLGERRYSEDKEDMFKRCYTGFLGEAATEIFFGVDFIDWSVGNTNAYDYADLNAVGLNAGIKTSRAPNFHLIKRNVKRPQIINIMMDYNKVLVGGFATVHALKLYTDDKLVINDKALKWKTGFWGIHALEPFSSVDELKALIK